MKVVMLTNASAPDKLGGLERYVDGLSRALATLGHDVTVVGKRMTPDAPRDEVTDGGVRILRYPVPSKQDPLFAPKYPVAVARGVSAALAEVGDLDVIHTHYPFPAMGPALKRARYVHTFHAPIWREFLVERQGTYRLPTLLHRSSLRGIRSVERVVLSRADRVVTLSQFMAEEASLITPRVRGKLLKIPGGVDIDRFRPGTATTPAGDGVFDIFTARRLVPRTGVAELVQAMPDILREFPDARLRVAGSGLQQAAIEAVISRLGLEESVELIGRVSDDELVERLRSADLVVTPTQELEGFGLSTAEALACGSPCLVTPAGANPEVVTSLGADLVTDDCTPDAIARGARSLLRDSGRRAVIAAGARAVVDPDMGWPVIAARHVTMYDDVLGQPG